MCHSDPMVSGSAVLPEEDLLMYDPNLCGDSSSLQDEAELSELIFQRFILSPQPCGDIFQ